MRKLRPGTQIQTTRRCCPAFRNITWSVPLDATIFWGCDAFHDWSVENVCSPKAETNNRKLGDLNYMHALIRDKASFLYWYSYYLHYLLTCTYCTFCHTKFGGGLQGRGNIIFLYSVCVEGYQEPEIFARTLISQKDFSTINKKPLRTTQKHMLT